MTTLRFRNYAFLGITRTAHGVALIRHALRARVRPRLALIAAETQAQLEASLPFHESPDDWWRWPQRRAVRRALADVLGPDVPESVPRLYHAHKIPFLFTPPLDSATGVRLLRGAAVDLAVMAEAPILQGEVLDLLPIVNVHAAPLPAYRGNGATYWALYHDEPLAVSAHLVERCVDRGPILGSKRLPVRHGDTLADVDARGFETCGELLGELLRRGRRAGIDLSPQQTWQGRTFRGAVPADIVAECERRLAAGEYTFAEPAR